MKPETANISIDEKVLIRQCQQGNAMAMEGLILKYQDRIHNVILRICANPDDAAELTQETFVRVIENIDKFKGKSSFYTWAFRIAVNLTLTFCKRKVKLGFKSLDATDDEQQSQTANSLKQALADEHTPDPAAIAENKELCEILVAALMKLDDDHRAVIVLRDIEGMNYAQIAEVLNLELGTVKSRLSRARGHLREIVEIFSK